MSSLTCSSPIITLGLHYPTRRKRVNQEELKELPQKKVSSLTLCKWLIIEDIASHPHQPRLLLFLPSLSTEQKNQIILHLSSLPGPTMHFPRRTRYNGTLSPGPTGKPVIRSAGTQSKHTRRFSADIKNNLPCGGGLGVSLRVWNSSFITVKLEKMSQCASGHRTTNTEMLSCCWHDPFLFQRAVIYVCLFPLAFDSTLGLLFSSHPSQEIWT